MFVWSLQHRDENTFRCFKTSGSSKVVITEREETETLKDLEDMRKGEENEVGTGSERKKVGVLEGVYYVDIVWNSRNVTGNFKMLSMFNSSLSTTACNYHTHTFDKRNSST